MAIPDERASWLESICARHVAVLISNEIFVGRGREDTYEEPIEHLEVKLGSASHVRQRCKEQKNKSVFADRRLSRDLQLTVILEQSAKDSVEAPSDDGQCRRMREVVARLASSFSSEIGQELPNLLEKDRQLSVVLRLGSEGRFLTRALRVRKKRIKESAVVDLRAEREGRTSSVAAPEYPVPPGAELFFP